MEGYPVVQHLNTARLDPEDRKYDPYQHARDWMEKSSMKMLLEQISERDKLHLWKLFRSTRSGSAFENTNVLCVINPTAGQVCALCLAMVWSSWSAEDLII
jgi:hypothetical protein